MKYPLIASKLYCEAWMIDPAMHESMCRQFRERAAADDPVGRVWRNSRGEVVAAEHPQVQVSGAVALMEVHGIIGKHLSGLEMMCGGYDIAKMGDQLRNVAEDETIGALVIDFRTPGGTALGMESAARSIREVSEAGKRVIGYTDTQCTSAGMYLAAACDEFHAEESARIGSISTFIAAVDDSRAWEMEGMERKLFATGSLKAMGMPGKKWTEEEEQFLQARVEEADRPFKQFMRDRRGVPDSAMTGGVWRAAEAPKELVDSTAFASLRELLEAVMSTA